MSRVEGYFVLPPDVAIRQPGPADNLPPDLATGDYVINRRGGRVHPRLISPSAARLLEFFREPTLVETAIIRYCEEHGGHPAEVLSSHVSLLCDLMNNAFLAPPESSIARSVEPSLDPDRSVGDFEVVHCVRASIDTEVYQARNRETGKLAALKIESAARLPEASDAIARETSILAELGGGVAPRLVARGRIAGAKYLLAEWCEGRSPEELAAAARYRQDTETRRASLDACCQILEAYVQLHAAGVIHGDVQPTNIVLPERGPARLIDFESAVRIADGEQGAEVPRGRADPFIEPELAAATLSGKPPPAPTERGEQYLIAANLYRILTGTDHLELSVIESELLSRIAESGIRPFEAVGHPPWPEVEAPLARALSRDPVARFDSVEELKLIFDAVRSRFPRRRVGASQDQLKASAGQIAERYAALTTTGEGWTVPSDGLSEGLEADDRIHAHSLSLGSGGVALGLLRISMNRSDPSLLAAADIWLTRSLRTCGSLPVPGPNGESNSPGVPSTTEVTINVPPHELFPTSEGTADISLYLGLPGLHFADTLLAISTGDRQRASNSADQFLVASSGVAQRLELFVGRAGTLLGLSILHRAYSERFGSVINNVLVSGDALSQEMQALLAGIRPVGDSGPENLGMAHGWAGLLYSVMHWNRSCGRSFPDPIRDRLEELANHGEKWGDAIRWPWVTSDDSGRVGVLFAPGWCNGSAGFVHLWVLANDLEPDDRYLERAVASARSVTYGRSPAVHLCCGSSGAAYALLELFRVTRDEEWLVRARRLLEESIHALPRGLEKTNRASLFRGEMGVAVAASEFGVPDEARMPGFG